MAGWMYRTAVAVKEFGERLAHKSLILADEIIRLGLAMQNWASKRPIH